MVFTACQHQSPPLTESGASRDKDGRMNVRRRKRDGEGRGRHKRAVCQLSPVAAAPAKICRCVRVWKRIWVLVKYRRLVSGGLMF